MDKKRRPVSTTPAFYMLLLLIVVWAMTHLPAARACSSDGRECSGCILDRFKYDCPPCVPILRCLSWCLWGGTSRAKCIKKCDCNSNGYPRLTDCKKCMSKCKCSCAQAS